MKLSIYSLRNILFEGQAKELLCNTSAGHITVLDNHEPYLAELQTGNLQLIDTAGSKHQFAIASGFVEVKEGSEVRCLVDEA